MVKIYKDLGKTAKKLLSDDFISDKKVQLKTKTSNGMTYTSTGVLSGKDESLSGDLSCKYVVKGATMTTKVLTSGKMTHETVLEQLGGKNAKLTVLAALGCGSQSLTPTLEFVHPNFAGVMSANMLGAPSVQPSVTVGSGSVTGGVQADVDVEGKQVQNVQGVVNYAPAKDYEATLWVMDKGDKLKFSFSHAVSMDFSVAAEFLYDKTGDSRLLTVGSKSEIDRDTTLKTKMNSAGMMSLSYIQEIRQGTTLTLSSSFDVRNLEKSGHKFGLSLVLE